ncbi:MAG: alkaline phosphatase family protein [Caldilineales bacterium]|nr:alkaline phosphatase family protein [Caldilineales bacterium]MDW8318740.1 alkaline phosphatase family protein [Anaerolineae bacterium]
MTWLLQRVLDLIELIVNWFYDRKYGAMVRRFGRGLAEDDRRRGLIILQIDGLSYTTLARALADGAMPYLSRLLEREGYRLQPWWCGVPSSTPAIQGGLMYGNNWNVPAFRWYEKTSGRTIVSKHPRDARLLQDRLSGGRPGLLAEGSSYLNIFDGGARLSLFTVSALGGQRFFENVRGVSFALLLLLSPLRLARAVWDVAWEFVRDLWQRLVGRFDTRVGRRRRPFSPLAALFQIFASVVFRELTTFGVLLDIYRRVPAIYANFYGYDDVAHQLGVLNAETRRILRSIDGRIREIDAARRRFAHRREYDLFVLSDHGMSPCTPFHELYGETLGEMLARLVQRESRPPVHLDESDTGSWRAGAEAQFLLEELRSIQANLSPRGRRLAARLIRFLERRMDLPDDPEAEADAEADPGAGTDADWDLSRRHELVVRSSGTLSLVYFTVTSAAMDLSEIELLYPGLLRRLVEHPGLGLVLGRERGRAMAMTLRGPRQLSPPTDPLVLDLLAHLPDPRLAAEQLARLVTFPAGGDLVLIGRWDSAGHTVAFESHWATHGGLGGDQNRPFLLLPPTVEWDVSHVRSPVELHKLFMARYGRTAGERRRSYYPQRAADADTPAAPTLPATG